tara:strand:+ start:223 stop:426 length:204 start_codon:yes stop_codon:yes gene_type:complete
MTAFEKAWSVIKDDDDKPKWDYKWDSPKALDLKICENCGYTSKRVDFRIDTGPREGMMRCPVCRRYF